MNIISLGAGVQSSTMALMAAKGELGFQPAFAVFADTQDEPDEVYDWLATLKRLLPFKVVQTTAGKLSDNLFKWGFSQIPCFTKNAEGQSAKGKRQCTNHSKLRPLYRAVREETGTARKRLPDGHFQMMIGISTDEASRMKPAKAPGVENIWPLIDKGLSRSGCKAWLKENGDFNPPKSACFYCPLKDNEAWARTSENPKLWPKVLAIEKQLNARGEFLHRSCIPIAEKPFLKAKDEGQLNLFNNECEGMCGL